MRSLLLVLRLCLLAIPVAAPMARAEETGAALEVRSLPAGTAIGILGQRVFDAGGTEIGRLVDVLVDLGGQPVAGVIDVGGFLGVKIAGDMGKKRIEDLSLDEVTGAPEYRSAEGASMVIGRRAARP